MHTIRAVAHRHVHGGVEVCDTISTVRRSVAPYSLEAYGPYGRRTNFRRYIYRSITSCSEYSLRSYVSAGNGCVPPSVLLVLVNEHLVKDNLALEFVLEVFATLKGERGVAPLVTALKKGQLEGKSVSVLRIPYSLIRNPRAQCRDDRDLAVRRELCAIHEEPHVLARRDASIRAASSLPPQTLTTLTLTPTQHRHRH